MEKPPYRIPSLDEINSIPANGIGVVSTFSGAGGSCLGYRMAGFSILWANEFTKHAQDTYARNHPSSILDKRDIRSISSQEIIAAIGNREIDVLDGSPPCQAFSMAGSREKNWGLLRNYEGQLQSNEQLFKEYIRLLRELKPKTFIAENVAGLIAGTAKGFFLDILCAMKTAGYRVRCAICCAARLGIPQKRRRLFFIGIRNDLPKTIFTFPQPFPYWYSVADALPHIKIISGNSSYCQTWMNSGDGPANTLTATRSNKINQVCGSDGATRHLTIEEMKLLCSFPSDFILHGSEIDQWRQLGNSVPPLMMRVLASSLFNQVFSNA